MPFALRNILHTVEKLPTPDDGCNEFMEYETMLIFVRAETRNFSKDKRTRSPQRHVDV